LSATNVVAGRLYTVALRNTQTVFRNITWGASPFLFAKQLSVPPESTAGFTFLAVELPGPVINLLPVGSDRVPEVILPTNNTILGFTASLNFDFTQVEQGSTYIMNTATDPTITSITTASIVSGKIYVFIFRNTSGSSRTLTMDGNSFVDIAGNSIVKVILTGEMAILTFMGTVGLLSPGLRRCVLTSDIS